MYDYIYNYIKFHLIRMHNYLCIILYKLFIFSVLTIHTTVLTNIYINIYNKVNCFIKPFLIYIIMIMNSQSFEFFEK